MGRSDRASSRRPRTWSPRLTSDTRSVKLDSRTLCARSRPRDCSRPDLLSGLSVEDVLVPIDEPHAARGRRVEAGRVAPRVGRAVLDVVRAVVLRVFLNLRPKIQESRFELISRHRRQARGAAVVRTEAEEDR